MAKDLHTFTGEEVIATEVPQYLNQNFSAIPNNLGVWEANEVVSVGDTRILNGRENAGYVLECTRAGTTGATQPTITDSDITDGTDINGLSGVLSIAGGGTNASDATTARANLGIVVATQAEAEDGTDNTKIMTPLQVANSKKYGSYQNRLTTINFAPSEIGGALNMFHCEAIGDCEGKPPMGSSHIIQLNHDARWGFDAQIAISQSYLNPQVSVRSMNGSGEWGDWKQLVNVEPDSIYQRNGYYRGKNLGTFSTVAEIDAFIETHKIADGTFDDIFVGDYLTLKDGTYNAIWLVAGVDIKYNKGDTALTKHHIALIPRTPLMNAQMNTENVTTGGYVGSAMHTSTMPTVATNMAKVLGGHLLTWRALLSTSIGTSLASMAGAGWTGASNGWAWTDVQACLLSEVEVYGSTVFSSSLYDVGEACEKLPIFNFIDVVQFSRWGFWLRAVASSTNFAFCNGYGLAYDSVASYSYGVRPLILVG